jgi:BON domain-containing protein
VTRQLVLACIAHPSIRRLVYTSVGHVYANKATEPNLLDEDAPLDLDPIQPQWIRDRVEADLTVCSHFGDPRLAIAVLRSAEILAPETGSQLWDYLSSRVCLRPLGFDPMINVLSIADQIRAIRLAARSDARGIFNIPGKDTLPLSRFIRRAHRVEVPVPGPLLAPLYQLRTWTVGLEFRYDLNMRRFHFGGVLDGTRARAAFGYRPLVSVWDPHGTSVERDRAMSTKRSYDHIVHETVPELDGTLRAQPAEAAPMTAELRARIADALTATGFGDVGFELARDRVILRGWVRDASRRHQIEHIVAAIEGVGRVDNQMHVGLPA